MDPTSSTNFNSHLVTHATAVRTKCEANITLRGKRTHKSLRRYMCISLFLTCDVVNLSSQSQTLTVDFNFGGKQVFNLLE